MGHLEKIQKIFDTWNKGKEFLTLAQQLQKQNDDKMSFRQI